MIRRILKGFICFGSNVTELAPVWGRRKERREFHGRGTLDPEDGLGWFVPELATGWSFAEKSGWQEALEPAAAKAQPQN